MNTSRSHRRQAGAVNTIWLIVVIVAWLATLGMWYVANTDIDRFRQLEADAVADRDELSARFDGVLAAHQELSDAVGYRDAGNPTSKSDLAAIQAEIDGLKSDLGDVVGSADSNVTLADAVSAARSAWASSVQALTQAQADYQRELGARQAAEANVNSVEANYRGELTALNQQLRDEQQRSDNQSTADAQRVSDLTQSEQAAQAAASQAQQSLADFQVQARRELSTAEGQIKALALRREPIEPDGIDGEVLSVGSAGQVAFIDLGGKHNLKRGTRFEVLRRGKGGVLSPRGTVEVREVQSDMSMVGLIGQADPFDPMLPGDVLKNPHFEVGRVMHFHLLGDFPLTLSKEFVSARLRELGAEVDDEVGTGTDVLVLGEKSLADGEFAEELTDSDEYKLADKLGMRIVRLDSLSQFLRY